MILEARLITKQFIRKKKDSNVFTAVKETSLSLNPGEITVLCGHSGSGKTTLLNMCAGLLTPTSGQVLFDGKDLYAMEDAALSRLRNAHFGVIPQGQTAIPSMTILENVLLPYTLYGSVKERDPSFAAALSRAEELLSLTGITSLRDARPNELSGGELRRMAIARALLLNPSVIFADEPTGDLDDENTEIVLSLLRGMASDGRAVLLVTHDHDAIACGDVIYRMNGGAMEPYRA